MDYGLKIAKKRNYRERISHQPGFSEFLNPGSYKKSYNNQGFFNPGYQPMISTQDINPGYQPRISIQDINPGYQPRISTKDINPGYQPRISTQDFNPGFQPRIATPGFLTDCTRFSGHRTCQMYVPFAF